jgi:hypothetical protein
MATSELCEAFLIRLLCLSHKWYTARFVVENGRQHEIWFNETILCAQHRHHSRLNSEHNLEEGQCDHFKRTTTFTLTS